MDDDTRALFQHRWKESTIQTDGCEQVCVEGMLPILVRQSQCFYWKMAMAQTAILFFPFVDILSLPIVLNLGLVLAVLSISEISECP